MEKIVFQSSKLTYVQHTLKRIENRGMKYYTVHRLHVIFQSRISSYLYLNFKISEFHWTVSLEGRGYFNKTTSKKNLAKNKVNNKTFYTWQS
jgi:hypothetical protein